MYGLLHVPSGKLLRARVTGGFPETGVRLDNDDTLPLWVSASLPVASTVRLLGDGTSGAGSFQFPLHLFDPEHLRLVRLSFTMEEVAPSELVLKYEELFPALPEDVVNRVIMDMVARGVAHYPNFSLPFMLERFHGVDPA